MRRSRMQSNSTDVVSPVCASTLVEPCRSVVGKHAARVVVVLLLLVIVHLAAWYYMYSSSTRHPSPLVHSPAAAPVIVKVDAKGNFTDRVERFNVELRNLRRRLRLT